MMKWKCLALTALLLQGLSGPLLACAVCFGAPGDKNTEAAGGAILFMLGVVAVVVGLFVAVALMLVCRAKKYRRTHGDEM